METTWKPIAGFEGKYEVSNTGFVRNAVRGNVLKPMMCGRIGMKYPTVRLSVNPRIDRKVHLLVLETFVGPCPEGHLGMHKDNDTSNAALSNLKWGTHAENAQQCAAEGRHASIKLPVAKRAEVRARRVAGEKGVVLAREYGVSQQTICDIFKERI